MLGLAFIYIRTSCMRAANALASLRICAESHEPSLLADGISTENSGTFVIHLSQYHTGQCKRIGGCYNELVVAFFSTGGGVKGKKIYTC